MVNETDIEAFSDTFKPHMEAADEYLRRFEKGLPTDRFAQSAEMERAVAKGIKGYQRLAAMLTQVIVSQHEQLKQFEVNARASMELGPKRKD